MIAREIAPALAAGCTVVAKPAENTPLTTLALARLAELAGVPAGVLNLVTASRINAAAVVDVWLADVRVRKLTFTGSTPVGQHLARASAGTLKKLRWSWAATRRSSCSTTPTSARQWPA